MLEYKEKRNRDFLAAVNALLRDPRTLDKTLREVVETAAASPAPSYYISYPYAFRWLNRNSTRELRPGLSRERWKMWRELREKTEKEMAVKGCPRDQALARVLCDSQASSFFISPQTAWSLYNQLMSGRTSYTYRPHLRRPRRP